MGIFSGIEMLFYTLGVLSTLLVIGLIQLDKKYRLQWYTWLTSATGAFLAVFAIAWSVSSVLEGEVQAANMGLLFFGLPALLLFGVTKKLLNAPLENS